MIECGGDKGAGSTRKGSEVGWNSRPSAKMVIDPINQQKRGERKMNRKMVRVFGVILVVAIPLLGGCASGSETAMLQAQANQIASNKDVVHTFIEMFQSGNWDDLDQVIASDCVLHHPGGEDVVGLEAMKADWQVFFGSLKDLNATPVAEISEGDLIVDFLTFQANYEGDYTGQQIAGVPIKYNQVEMMRIADGKIVEWWVEYDRLWMSQQLGFDLVPQ
jgi:predicted ester cyclase